MRRKTAAFNYLDREVCREIASLSPDLDALTYARLMDAYQFMLTRIKTARLIAGSDSPSSAAPSPGSDAPT